MHEIVPWKVVEMSATACEKEASGDGIGVLRRLIAFGPSAIFVHEPGALGPVAALFAFEKTEIVLGKKATLDASKPSRERSYRHPDEGLGRKGIDIVGFGKRRHAKALYL